MSAREYRDAVRGIERLEYTIRDMKIDVSQRLQELNGEIKEAEGYLRESRKILVDLGGALESVFMIKVDNEMVFRAARDKKIQIIEITEE